MKSANRTILVAGMGTSPAVLTETVWALAHQKEPVVPDEVAVITTEKGKSDLIDAILSGKPSIWDRLVEALRREKIGVDGKLKFKEGDIKVMLDASHEFMRDLRTAEDNFAAADFMLKELRGYASPDTTILCSIAGGRKTMSALLFSCMTLVGREQDKVYHVLIPPEYECGMEPPFFFPQKGMTHQLLARGKPSGKTVQSMKIGIERFDVPFVRIRGWFQEKFKTPPPSYRSLIDKVQTIAPPAVTYPEIEIDAWNCVVFVGGTVVKLSATCFAALIALSNGIHGRNLHARLVEATNGPKGGPCEWLAELREGSRFKQADAKEDVNKVMSELRKKFSSAGFANVEALVPQRGRAVAFPVAQITWRNREKFADVCGCLFPGVPK